MHHQKEHPAVLAARAGVPVALDLAGGSINPEYAKSLRELQAQHLTRRYAVALAMASIVAPLLYGEGTR